MYKVYKNGLLADTLQEKFNTIDSAIAYAKAAKKENGGYYFIEDKSRNKVWNT